MSSKIQPLSKLNQKLKSLRLKKKKIVFTNGCFDILHLGHVRLLEKAKRCGDVLVVGLNSDRSIRQIKGNSRPILSEKDRAGILAALESVDFVTLFSEPTPAKLIARLKPDVLVKGGDYQLGKIVGSGSVRKNGGKVVTFPLVKGRSTTNIIKKLKR